MKLKEILTPSEKRKAVAQIRNAVPCASNYHDCMFEMPQNEWDAYRIFEDDTSNTFAISTLQQCIERIPCKNAVRAARDYNLCKILLIKV